MRATLPVAANPGLRSGMDRPGAGGKRTQNRVAGNGCAPSPRARRCVRPTQREPLIVLDAFGIDRPGGEAEQTIGFVEDRGRAGPCERQPGGDASAREHVVEDRLIRMLHPRTLVEPQPDRSVTRWDL